MSLSFSPRVTAEKMAVFSSSLGPTILTEVTLTRESAERLNTKVDQILPKLAEALRPAHFQIEEWIHVRSSHPDFVGRQSFLDLLSQPLSNQPNPHSPLTVRVVSGPAGFGKTELVIQFANINKNHFSLIRLFHSEIEELFEQEMRDFGKALGLSLEKEPKERVLHLIYRRLSQGIEDKPYLLIFDNVETPISLPEHGGFCLLTTRHPNLHPYPQQVIEISPFSPEETQALYQQLYNKPLSLEHATTLTEKLEGYPVLLGLALRELRYVSIDDYLQNLESPRPLIQQCSERYPQALKTLISAIGRRLEELDRLAFRFFHLCTHLNPDHISLAFLQEWLQSQTIEDPVQVGRGIVHSLTDSSLMQYDAVSQAFSLHRLTQMIFQELHTQDSYDQVLSLVLQHAERFKRDDLASWEKGKEGVAQLPFIHKNPFWHQGNPEKKITLLHKAGDYLLTVQGEARGAHLYFEEALDCSLRQQQNPLLQAQSYNGIGVAFQALGRYEEALENQQQALKIQLKALGQVHSDVAASYNGIGVAFQALGRYEEALENQQQALKIQLKALGQDHSDLAKSYGNIGVAFGALGQHEKALENYQQALKIQLTALGEDHPDVAQSYNNIGVAFGALGQHEKALENYQLALNIRLKVLGQDHPDVAQSYNNIGVAFDALGQHEKALENKQLALKIQLKASEQDHPDVATSYHNIGVAFDALGQHEKALENKQLALEIRLKALGQDHPDVAVSYNGIGITFGALGQHKKALQNYQRGLEIRLKALGQVHSDVAASYNNIGVAFHALGQYEKALENYQLALKIQRSPLGQDHPDVAQSYNNIGVTFDALGQQSEALNSYKQALFIQWRSQRDSNLELLRIRMNNFLSCLKRDKHLWKSSVVKEVEGFLNQQLGENHSLTLRFEQAKKQALSSNCTIQ